MNTRFIQEYGTLTPMLARLGDPRMHYPPLDGATMLHTYAI